MTWRKPWRSAGRLLDWLKGELTAWGKLMESSPPETRPLIVKTLSHWRQDKPPLAGIRDAEALALSATVSEVPTLTATTVPPVTLL